MKRNASSIHVNNSLRSQIFLIRKVRKQLKWNKDEDRLLIKYVEQFNEKNWKEVASKFYNKNILQCFSRYKRIRPGIKRGTWKQDEDIKILKLIQKYGTSWSQISKELNTRTAKQIRDRYLNVLDPKINKNKFSFSEECHIIRLYKSVGSKWALIAKEFPHRTANMIKNRFYSSIKKRLSGCCQQELSGSKDEIKHNYELVSFIDNLFDMNNLKYSFDIHNQASIINQTNKEISFNTLFDTNFFSHEQYDNKFHTDINTIFSVNNPMTSLDEVGLSEFNNKNYL